MTKIWVLSDLHQEFVRDREHGRHPMTAFDPARHDPGDVDVVVVAGDVDVPLERAVDWVGERFSGHPAVVYVPGNHDFYTAPGPGHGFTMAEALDRGREAAARTGVHLLSDDAVVLAGPRFAGGTLWTDFVSVGIGNPTYKQRRAQGRDGLNDYRRIKRESTKHPGKLKPLRPEDTVAAHRRTRAFLEDTLAVPFDGATVVVTHHAPHPASLADPLADRSWCYASQMRLMLEAEDAPDMWIHGHTHRPVDYLAGRTRVVANPRGYQFDKDLDQGNGFSPSLVVEVLPGRRPPLLPSDIVIHRETGESEEDFLGRASFLNPALT